MKKIGLLLIALLLVSCNSAEDCFKKSGDIIVKNIELQDFSKVKIFSGLALVIKQGATFEVKIEGGANFINDIELRKEGDLLTAKYNASCNFNREYKAGTIYVTAPNIEEIHSKTEQDIKSDGVLNFPVLSQDMTPARANVVQIFLYQWLASFLTNTHHTFRILVLVFAQSRKATDGYDKLLFLRHRPTLLQFVFQIEAVDLHRYAFLTQYT